MPSAQKLPHRLPPAGAIGDGSFRSDVHTHGPGQKQPVATDRFPIGYVLVSNL